MKKEFGLIICAPKEQCSDEERRYMWAQYIYKLWQIKERLNQQAG